jgi:hypothetical protein
MIVNGGVPRALNNASHAAWNAAMLSQPSGIQRVDKLARLARDGRAK